MKNSAKLKLNFKISLLFIISLLSFFPTKIYAGMNTTEPQEGASSKSQDVASMRETIQKDISTLKELIKQRTSLNGEYMSYTQQLLATQKDINSRLDYFPNLYGAGRLLPENAKKAEQFLAETENLYIPSKDRRPRNLDKIYGRLKSILS